MARTRSSKHIDRGLTNDDGSNEQTPEDMERTKKSAQDLKHKLTHFKHTSTDAVTNVVGDTSPDTTTTGSKAEHPIPQNATQPSSVLGKRLRQTTLFGSSTADAPSPSPFPAKASKPSNKYAPPTKYAHLPELTDVIEPNLICIFVGTNPGIRTATAGHAYAHPSNLFWRLLHSSGCTDERLRPEQDGDLPRLYSMGNTNIVARPSRDQAELSKAEMAAGTPILEAKFAEFRPEAVCIVGKGIWEAVWRWRYGREIKKTEFKYGWQDEGERMGRGKEWAGARVFVATTTSGLSAGMSLQEKQRIWTPFGQWVKKRREERARVKEEDGDREEGNGGDEGKQAESEQPVKEEEDVKEDV